MGRFDTTTFEKRLVLESSFSEVQVTLPRFECSFDWIDLSESMKKFGVETLFDADKANLTNISDDPLYVTKVMKARLFKQSNTKLLTNKSHSCLSCKM